MPEIVFRLLGFVFNAILLPMSPPTTATAPHGIANSGSNPPCNALPTNPVNAVAASIAVAVPTAVRTGTPQPTTINGTRNDPPEIPSIPEKKPVAKVNGTAKSPFEPVFLEATLQRQPQTTARTI